MPSRGCLEIAEVLFLASDEEPDQSGKDGDAAVGVAVLVELEVVHDTFEAVLAVAHQTDSVLDGNKSNSEQDKRLSESTTRVAFRVRERRQEQLKNTSGLWYRSLFASASSFSV